MRLFYTIFIPLFLVSHYSSAQIAFTELESESTGINFQNTLYESPQINVLTYQYYHNGGGVCLGDLNNDGLLDVYFTSNMEPNRLFVNKGNMQFEDVSEKANISGTQGWATGATMVDINNDGLLDIYVCKSGNLNTNMRRNCLYINQGNLKFTEEAQKYGLDDPSYSTQSYFFDYDLDGDLDMYLLNHPIAPFQPTDEKAANFNFDRDPNAGDKLFRNDNGVYTDVSEAAGIKGSPISYGLSVSIGDMNGDRYPDMYVCNDYMERDYLFLNNGKGGFTDELLERVGHISNYSMGSDIADINNDGHLDLFIADMAAEDNYRSKTNMSGMNPERFWNYVNHGFHYQYMINTLQLNNGDANFSEIAQLAGVDKTDWSWAPLFVDFDQDGSRDLFVTNGLRKEARNNDFVKKKKEIMKKLQQYPDSAQFYMKTILETMPAEKISNVMYRNNGDLHFTKSGNTGMERPTFSNGAAYGDLDNDGDMDLIVNNIDHLASVYRNDAKSSNYLKIALTGNANNTFGIGAHIIVTAGDLIQTAEHYLTRGYLSSNTEVMHFGVGNHTKIDRIEVRWFDGSISSLENIDANQQLEISYATKASTASVKKTPEILETKLIRLEYEHGENEFDDFEREVLLPHKMSAMGPAIATADVNADGLDDFYVCGATGYPGALLLQQKDGTFASSGSIWEEHAMREEVAAHFFDYDQDGDPDLYIGVGGNETDNGDAQLSDLFYENIAGTFELKDNLPEGLRFSTGCISSCDYDRDGDLDLFIGNRQTPGKYPFASNSYLLNNDKGQFRAVDNLSVLENLGMVTNAIWQDLNGDGQPDLVVSGEWMPITVLEQNNGQFLDRTAAYGLTGSEGWWFGLAAGDIDNDGDIDFIGGNLGLNYKYKASERGPFHIYSEDINDDGKNDIVLGYNQNGKNYPLRGRQCSSEQIPEIKADFPTYDEFASATIEDVYGEHLNAALHYTISDFHSCVWINEGGKFKRVNFAHDLQRFNWNSIVLKDINNDGNLDIITAGNLHDAEVETPRCDAGKGLVLLGDGSGQFSEINTSTMEWGAGNVKSLQLLTISGMTGVVVGRNSGWVELLVFKP